MRNPQQLAAGSSKTTPCCSKVGIKRGPWTAEEDEILASYINKEGEGRWRTLPSRAGLPRCGKSCRLRWMNYLRPHLKRSHISLDEEDLILRLHRLLGNRWSLIAGRIPGRTDNEIKNYWNTHLSKKLISQGLDPRTHKPLENYNPNPSDPSPAESSMDVAPNPNPNLPTTEPCDPPPPHAHPLPMAGCSSNSHGGGEEVGACDHDNSSYNDEMYFSSILDSLIMDDDNHALQDESMAMMMMQPMGYGSSSDQGFDHRRFSLSAAAFWF